MSTPRTEEANGTEAAHPFVSVVGAAWLLMGQPGVTETRAIADSPTPRPARARMSRRHRGSPPSNYAAQSGFPTTQRVGPRIGSSAGGGGSAGTGASKRADPTTLNAGRNGLPRISKARRTSHDY